MTEPRIQLYKYISQEEKLARHAAGAGGRVVTKENIKGHEVCLIEGGPHYDAPQAFPEGYWVAAFAVKRGKQWMIETMWFDYSHDLELPDRPAARLNTARKRAVNHIETGLKGKMYR